MWESVASSEDQFPFASHLDCITNPYAFVNLALILL